tara:strand:+ start:159 stop:530 length:372 start_codon:yes stop_codon:yes gene_type:complete
MSSFRDQLAMNNSKKIHLWCKKMERSYYTIWVFDRFNKSLYSYKKHYEQKVQRLEYPLNLDIKSKIRMIKRSNDLIDLVYKNKIIEIYFNTKNGITFIEEEKICDSIKKMINSDEFDYVVISK